MGIHQETERDHPPGRLAQPKTCRALPDAWGQWVNILGDLALLQISCLAERRSRRLPYTGKARLAGGTGRVRV